MRKQKSRPAGDRAAPEIVLADVQAITANQTIPQPASVCKFQALHLIAHRHVRPAMALTLAALAYGEPR